jgi:hypothetical protein
MFAVLADSRTGSHLLRSLLDSHPQLTCFDEILGLRKSEKDFYQLGEHEGCLVNYANLIAGDRLAAGNDIQRIIGILREVPVIHLIRDLSERARSQLFYTRASRKGKSPFRKANLETDVWIPQQLTAGDAEQLAAIEQMFRGRQNACFTALSPLPEHCLEISYEWLCGDKQLKRLDKAKARVLCDYLQVPVAKLATNLYKIRKSDVSPA